jgi:type IV pilus biogenesis protein CpaD/CtpE
LRLSGVKNVTTRIMPVSGHGTASAVEISFATVKAQPPAGCTVMPGVEDRGTFIASDYKSGCTVDTLLSRQIARPADLKGREGLDAANGRRQTNIVESYRAGVGNSSLGGYTTQ